MMATSSGCWEEEYHRIAAKTFAASTKKRPGLVQLRAFLTRIASFEFLLNPLQPVVRRL